MPKLPKGMFKRPGRRSYYTRMRVAGKDKWVSLGPDYEEAVHALRKLRIDDQPLRRADLKVSKAARRWLKTRIANGRNAKGQQIAAARVRKFLEPFMGHMIVSKITTDTLRRYRLWVEEQCKTPGMVAHVLGDCRGFLYWCEEAGLIDKTPIPRRWLPRVPEKEPDRLLDDEVEKVIALEDPHGFVCRLALGTGLRWGELCRLQARDLQKGVLVIGQTKSGRIRRIPVSPELRKEIRGHVGKLVPFAEKSPGSFAKAVRRRTKIERFHVHQMRHTFACRWLERGGSLAALQELLGHASIVTTQRYARLSDDLVRREAERVGMG